MNQNTKTVLAIALLSGSILIIILIALACMTCRSSRKRKEVMKEDENQDYGEGYELQYSVSEIVDENCYYGR